VHEIHNNNRGYIIICYVNEPNEYTFKIIGSGTILIESKIIRGCRLVGHIEDIVVKEKYRGNNISQTILDLLQEYAIKQNCYKVILDCKRSIKKVYEKNNFVEKDIQMVTYL
jgi:GNAT superfamily N-acetyltransferase